jgi:excinuclease ABC subunit A
MSNQFIEVEKARVHNLQNVDVKIPHKKLVVFTGLSGSGKSSLAFDTIYAEGQRRYIETFSAYARQFLGNLEKPDVDKISGLSPVISIEQKSVNKNPRSTVGTITEIYDFLRLLYARIGTAYSYLSGKKMVKYTEEQLIELIYSEYEDHHLYLYAPVVKGRKGHYKELFESIRKKGFIYARIDGEIRELSYGLKLDRYKTHDIEIVIDRLKLTKNELKRFKESFGLALKHGNGIINISSQENPDIRFYSKYLMCPETGISYDEPAPHSFSFNSPKGACEKCNGLGKISEVDIDKIIPDHNLSIKNGGIVAIGKYRSSLIFWQLESIGRKYDFTLDTPIKDISDDAINIILYGSGETFRLEQTPLGTSSNYMLTFDGIINYISRQKDDNASKQVQRWADQFIEKKVCPACNGNRLKKESLFFRIDDKNISEAAKLDIKELYKWTQVLNEKLNEKEKTIAREVLKEINNRLSFLLGVGLDYLSLDREARSLSGGESQRIRLATQIGSKLVNVLYILDEPSIGLHARDNSKLIESLHNLRDIGNSIIVVEHDKETILSADYIVDIGPGAGNNGGKIVVEGDVKSAMKKDSITMQYLKDEKSIIVPDERRSGNGKKITIKNASGNNLKNVTVDIPLGKFCCITGVSGSGKSTLINNTLYPYLNNLIYGGVKKVLDFESIEGIENIDKVVEVNQAPLGKTPRSNPATYTGLFTEIRKLFESLPESKVRGYKAGRFSFNVKGGRCEGCKGAGVKTIEMNFLPDVYVECDECHGKRYNRETLEVKYKGKSISDVLNMTIENAYSFFSSFPKMRKTLATLLNVGLGYIKLGQASTTLSGGESQRVKLASELAKKDTGKTIYILDEPTTGLHFEDVRILLEVLQSLVEKGNTVLVIEHNMDVIKVADHIIDLGPEGGKEGGYIIGEGTPEQICKLKKSYTAKYLKQELS